MTILSLINQTQLTSAKRGSVPQPRPRNPRGTPGPGNEQPLNWSLLHHAKTRQIERIRKISRQSKRELMEWLPWFIGQGNNQLSWRVFNECNFLPIFWISVAISKNLPVEMVAETTAWWKLNSGLIVHQSIEFYLSTRYLLWDGTGRVHQGNPCGRASVLCKYITEPAVHAY